MTALRLLGALLLTAAGTGGGWAAARRRQRECEQVARFGELLAYLGQLLAYQALPAPVLLARALHCTGRETEAWSNCTALAELPIPPCLPEPLQNELRSGLAALELLPRTAACDALQHMAGLCRAQADTMQKSADEARRLWPRLGASAGLLAAILLW